VHPILGLLGLSASISQAGQQNCSLKLFARTAKWQRYFFRDQIVADEKINKECFVAFGKEMNGNYF
jgi:hypothetical protein